MKSLLGIFSTNWRDPQTCQGCGQPFVCGATPAGCWCSSIKISAETRAKLRELYQGCLCASCLERCAKYGVERTTGSQENV